MIELTSFLLCVVDGGVQSLSAARGKCLKCRPPNFEKISLFFRSIAFSQTKFDKDTLT